MCRLDSKFDAGKIQALVRIVCKSGNNNDRFMVSMRYLKECGYCDCDIGGKRRTCVFRDISQHVAWLIEDSESGEMNRITEDDLLALISA